MPDGSAVRGRIVVRVGVGKFAGRVAGYTIDRIGRRPGIELRIVLPRALTRIVVKEQLRARQPVHIPLRIGLNVTPGVVAGEVRLLPAVVSRGVVM